VRALKLTGIVLGVLVALIALMLIGVRLFVNPNDFKGRIEKAVKDQTGRELHLPGDIKLSVFPWIALELGPVSLSNPTGFPAEPFIQVKHLALRVRLLPLLHKELNVGRIDIDGLDLRLLKNAQGKGNWEDFGGKETPAPAPAAAGSSIPALRDLSGVTITDSRISYQDMVANGVNLSIGRVAAGATTPVSLETQLTSGRGAAPLELSLKLDLAPDFATKKYQVSKLELQGARAAADGVHALQVKFDTPAATADLGAQTLSVPAFSAQLAGAKLSGEFSGSKIVDAPRFSGSFKLDPVSPRDLMAALGIEPPKTRDAAVLKKLAGSGAFSYAGSVLGLQKFALQLDDSTLKGEATDSLDSKVMTFQLALDHIDLDRYRPPEERATAAQPAVNSATGQDATLKTLRLNGAATIGQATVSNLKVTHVSATVAAKDGIVHLAPVHAQLYGGAFSGDITLDARTPENAFKIDETLTNVDMAALLKDFAKSQRLSGRGNISGTFAGGGSGDAMLRSLNGHVAANLDNGAVEGVDLWFEINRAMAVIQKQGLPSGQSSGRTTFDSFKASADLAGGVATTKDLNIVSRNLRVTGQGTSNLATEAVSYQIQAIVLKKVAPGPVASGNVLAQIPVNVSGTMGSPKVTPDLEGLAKARMQQELDKHKGELQQKLQDQLKGLFSK
jgi:AsmA protein